MSGTKSAMELKDIASSVEILKVMECPSCEKVPSPPVYLCEGGHSLCGVCKPKLNACPVCKLKLTETRNHLAEKILTSSIYYCRNKNEGCGAEARIELMEIHRDVCPFRPVLCPLIYQEDCAMVAVNLSVLKRHLIEVHSVDISTGAIEVSQIEIASADKLRMIGDSLAIPPIGKCTMLTKENQCWIPHMSEFDGQSFIIQNILFRDMVCFAVSTIGPEYDESKYLAKITLNIRPNHTLDCILPVKSIVRRLGGNFVACINLNQYKEFATTTDIGFEIKIRYELIKIPVTLPPMFIPSIT